MSTTRGIVRLRSVALGPSDSYTHRITYVDENGAALNLTLAGRRAVCRVEAPDGTVLHTLTTPGAGTSYVTDGTDGVVEFFLTLAQVAALTPGVIYTVFFRWEDDNATPTPEALDLAYLNLIVRND